MKTYAYLAVAFCMLMTACFAVIFICDVLKATWCTLKDKPYKWKSFESFTNCKDWKVILFLGVMICVGVYGFFVASIDIVRSKYETEDEFCNLCETYLLKNDDSSKCYHDYVYCDYCSASFPEEYAFRKIEGDAESYAQSAAKKAAFEATYNGELSGNPLGQGAVNKIYDEAYQEAYQYASKNTVCPSCVYSDFSEIIEKIAERPYAFSEDVFYVKKAECAWCGNLAPADLYNVDGDRICTDCISEALQDKRLSIALEEYSEDK